MAVITVILPVPLTPRAVTSTMRILHFTSIKHVHIARSTVAMDRARSSSGALRALPLTLFAPHERLCARAFDRLAGEAAFARGRRWGL